jgi:hypothetical protein
MNRFQFIIVTSLSGVIFFCIFLQIILVRVSATDDQRARAAQATIQKGQLCFTRLQQIAGRIAQVAQQQDDQQLKDLLQRQNIQIKPTPATTGTPAPAASTTPTTH